MAASKAAALPLGDRPTADSLRYLNMVRKGRLELPHLAAPEPKSGASTNFATSATCSIDNSTWIDYRIIVVIWQVYLDSNQGMAASKAAALPLGDRPTADSLRYLNMVRKGRLELPHLAAPEPKSGASTNFAISACFPKSSI